MSAPGGIRSQDALEQNLGVEWQEQPDKATSRQKEVLFNVPNLLTTFRLILIPLIAYFLGMPGRKLRYVTLGLIYLGGIIDILDGHLARRLRQSTNFGKILDPIVDRIEMFVILALLISLRGFPVWAAIVFVGMDMLLFLSGVYYHKFDGRRVPDTSAWGKVRGPVLICLFTAYVLEVPSQEVKLGLVFLGLLVSLASFHQVMRSWAWAKSQTR